MKLADISYKDLNIGQRLFILEECGIDQSLVITTYYLAEFSVDAFGVGCIKVDDGIKGRHSKFSYDWRDFDKIFLTQDDAIKYCEENNRAYSFLERYFKR